MWVRLPSSVWIRISKILLVASPLCRSRSPDLDPVCDLAIANYRCVKVLTALENRRGTFFYRHLGPTDLKESPFLP